MAKTTTGKRIRWTDDELDNYYRAAITERRDAEYLMTNSRNGRTWAAINTKLWKEFGIVQRTADNGNVYMYLADEVPDNIKRRRKQAISKPQAKRKAKPVQNVSGLTKAQYDELYTALQGELNNVYLMIGKKESELFEMKQIAIKWQKKLVELKKG